MEELARGNHRHERNQTLSNPDPRGHGGRGTQAEMDEPNERNTNQVGSDRESRSLAPGGVLGGRRGVEIGGGRSTSRRRCRNSPPLSVRSPSPGGHGGWAVKKRGLVRRGGGVGNGANMAPLLAAGWITKCGCREAVLRTGRGDNGGGGNGCLPLPADARGVPKQGPAAGSAAQRKRNASKVLDLRVVRPPASKT